MTAFMLLFLILLLLAVFDMLHDVLVRIANALDELVQQGRK